MQYLSSYNGNYHFRARIPNNLYLFFNRKEIKRSLQTRCYNTARSLNKKWSYHYDKLIQRLSMNILSDKQIELYVKKFLDSTLQELEDERIGRDNPSNNLMDDMDLFDEFRAEFKGHLLNGRYKCVQKEIEEIIDTNNITIDTNDITYKKLARELIKARIKILNIEEQRSAGNYENDYDKSLKSSNTSNQQSVKVKETITLKALTKDYIEEKSISKEWDNDTAGDVNYIFKIMLELLGEKKDINTLNHKELIRFRNSLRKLPKNISKKKDWADKSIQSLIDLNLDESLVLSTTTVNKYTSRVFSLFDYAHKYGYIKVNPALDLALKNNKKENEERDPFTDDDLQAIFTMPIYTNDLEVTIMDKPEKVWIPIFALFQGMRLNEICQLYKEDVYKIDNIWCIDINEKLDKKFKNKPSNRMIPIHPKVLEFGFIEYFNSLPKEQERVWPNLTFTKGKGYANGYGKSFLRLKCKHITLDTKRVFHSFRHNVGDNLKQILQPERLVEALLGHANSSMSTTRYGKDYKPQVQFRMLKKLKYNIKFPFENLLPK